jgi:hypothetical protein
MKWINPAMAACLAIALTITPAAFAQAQGSSASPGGTKDHGAMRNMGSSKDTAPSNSTGTTGENMKQTMAQCTEMREQMKQNKPMTPEMSRMMRDCDQMDRQMDMPSSTKSR